MTDRKLADLRCLCSRHDEFSNFRAWAIGSKKYRALCDCAVAERGEHKVTLLAEPKIRKVLAVLEMTKI